MSKYKLYKIVDATPKKKDGVEGYEVLNPDGFVGWWEKKAFEANHTLEQTGDFCRALDLMRLGRKVTRVVWEKQQDHILGYKHYLSIVNGFFIVTYANGVNYVWTPKQEDILALDFVEV